MKKYIERNIFCVVFYACMAFATPSFANSLINNSATGVVMGNISQQGDSTIEMGAITYQDEDVVNVTVSATVGGDIVAGSGAHISIGSYHGK